MSYKYYTIDRIEEDIAVLFDDDENKSDIPVSELPENIKESDILKFDAENNIYTIDYESTEQRKSSLEKRFKKLFKK
ncbi:MAG: DUF3006 domain-containing protein [Oscillospiraceae bacterium]|nr:DUF3006 domain-containing protein [Oscillospiraceae bacterium]